jgi:hypothetical protein
VLFCIWKAIKSTLRKSYLNFDLFKLIFTIQDICYPSIPIRRQCARLVRG